MLNRNEMIEELHNHICNVTFTKVSGEKRVMKCTLKNDMVPVQESKTSSRKSSDEVVVCYDVENNGWRSFREDSVTDFVVVS